MVSKFIVINFEAQRNLLTAFIMENIISKLRDTQGIFDTVMSSKHTFPDNMVYRSIGQDKTNINNDMRAFFSDFKKATNEATVKQAHYE